MSKPFHITHAAIGSPKVNWLVSVRAVVNDNDYVLCYLGSASGKEGASTLQQSLNLEVAEGEEVVLYTQPTSPACKQNYSVHLTGYYADDLYTPTESDILEAAMEEEDPDESYAQLEDVSLQDDIFFFFWLLYLANILVSTKLQWCSKDNCDAHTSLHDGLGPMLHCMQILFLPCRYYCILSFSFAFEHWETLGILMERTHLPAKVVA